jgi:xanthine dehydrogenase YagT iron-sulfur-binding subunit
MPDVWDDWLDGRGRPISLREVRGAPVVIAAVGRWRVEEGQPSAAALRAELRGLGAALAVVTPSDVWLVQPDDPVERLQPAGRAGPADQSARRLLAALEPEPEGGASERSGPKLTLVMLDGAAPTWRWTGAAGADEVDTLLSALRRTAELHGDLPSDGAGAAISMTRRTVLMASLAAALGATVAEPRAALAAAVSRPSAAIEAGLVKLEVNGKVRALQLEARVTLLDALRERLGLTGTKKGCDHGQCGACTVLIDGRRVLSCLTLAIMHQGQRVTTIEGLAEGNQLHPMQAAFLEHDGFQCGYCTPGQIMSAVGMLGEGHARSAEDVREQMSGNICRCGAYPNILAAIEQVRRH